MTNGNRAWAAVAVWAAIQLTLTSLPGKAVPVALPHPWDWSGHLCLYGGLGVLIARAAVIRGWPLRRLVWVALLVSAAAALDELHQLFIPGRSAEVGDWLSDTIGAAIGLTVGARLMTSRLATWLR
jgi:VanZ family protein